MSILPQMVDAPADASCPAAGIQTLDRKALTVLVTAALALTLLNYTASVEVLEQIGSLLSFIGLHELAADAGQLAAQWGDDPLARLAWWAGASVAAYFALPALVIRLVFREPLSPYGVKRAGALRGLPLYLGMLTLMMPIVVFISGTAGFQAAYPFYPVPRGETLAPGFWCWELLYAAQFVALEFFFRGFLVHGTRHCFGVNSVLVMIVPYCMIHFGKPMPETLVSIVAGLALGLMSYRTRSIWLGAALHIAVAWSMDAAVLLRRG